MKKRTAYSYLMFVALIAIFILNACEDKVDGSPDFSATYPAYVELKDTASSFVFDSTATSFELTATVQLVTARGEDIKVLYNYTGTINAQGSIVIEAGNIDNKIKIPLDASVALTKGKIRVNLTEVDQGLTIGKTNVVGTQSYISANVYWEPDL